MLLERLRDAPGYCQKRRSYNIIGKDFGCSAAVVKSVVEDFGLFAFTEDGERFYSEELCEQMDERQERLEFFREAGKKGGRPKRQAENPGLENEKPGVSEKKPGVSISKPSINQVNHSIIQSITQLPCN